MRGLSESEVAVLRDLLVTAGIDVQSDTDLNELLDIFKSLVEERKRVTAKYAVGLNKYRLYTNNEWPDEN